MDLQRKMAGTPAYGLLCDLSYDFLERSLKEKGYEPDIVLVKNLKLTNILLILKDYIEKHQLGKKDKLLVVAMMRYSDGVYFRQFHGCQGYKHRHVPMREPTLPYRKIKFSDFTAVQEKVINFATESGMEIDF